jgi:hypothetical protein
MTGRWERFDFDELLLIDNALINYDGYYKGAKWGEIADNMAEAVQDELNRRRGDDEGTGSV